MSVSGVPSHRDAAAAGPWPASQDGSRSAIRAQWTRPRVEVVAAPACAARRPSAVAYDQPVRPLVEPAVAATSSRCRVPSDKRACRETRRPTGVAGSPKTAASRARFHGAPSRPHMGRGQSPGDDPTLGSARCRSGAPSSRSPGFTKIIGPTGAHRRSKATNPAIIQPGVRGVNPHHAPCAATRGPSCGGPPRARGCRLAAVWCAGVSGRSAPQGVDEVGEGQGVVPRCTARPGEERRGSARRGPPPPGGDFPPGPVSGPHHSGASCPRAVRSAAVSRAMRCAPPRIRRVMQVTILHRFAIAVRPGSRASRRRAGGSIDHGANGTPPRGRARPGRGVLRP